MIGVDCEGAPVSAPVDVCVEPPSGWRLDVVKRRLVDPVLKATTADMIASWMDRHTFQLHPGGPVPAPKTVRVDDGFGNIDPEKVREALPGVPVVSHPTVKGAVLIGAAHLLTRTLEAEADALSFPPAGSVWRLIGTTVTGTVEYSPNGRRWRLLFDDGPGEWSHHGMPDDDWERVEPVDAPAPEASADEPITIVAESVAIPKIKIGQVWRRGSWVPDGQIRADMERIRIVRYQALGALWGVEPADAADSWALCWIGETEIRTAFELEAEPVAPQAVTLEVGTINAADPGGYRSPADAHLPAPEVPRE